MQRRHEVLAAGDAEPVLVQRPCVLLAATEHRHLADAAKVTGVEAADHAGADYADAVDSASLVRSIPRRASSRGSSRHSEPRSSGSEKISRS